MKAAGKRVKFVLDASVTLSWAFADESNPVAARARQILESPEGAAVVPILWWYEVRNILIVSERRSRITADGTSLFLAQLAQINITTAPVPSNDSLLDLARQNRLSVYDAAYLAIATELKLPIATLDRALVTAAALMNIPLLSEIDPIPVA
jgi:predicted nucleic acid-binding protein